MEVEPVSSFTEEGRRAALAHTRTQPLPWYVHCLKSAVEGRMTRVEISCCIHVSHIPAQCYFRESTAGPVRGSTNPRSLSQMGLINANAECLISAE